MSAFDPDLSILPLHQRALWSELSVVPPHYVLYGGTAIALRLGHRQSVDFDFMSHRSFTPETIVESFGISPDGARLAVATRESMSNLVMAESVPGSYPGGSCSACRAYRP